MGKAAAFIHYPALPQALWGALNPNSSRALALAGPEQQQPCLGLRCGCAGATPCPLPALLPVLGWVCHKSIPVYATGSQSQARGALESSLWMCNFVLLTLTPHLIFHSPGNAFLCQRQRLAARSATDICIIRLGLQSLCSAR